MSNDAIPAVRWEEATELEVMRAAINEDDPDAADEIRRRSAGNDDELIRLGCGNLAGNVRSGLIEKSGRNDINRDAIDVLMRRLADTLRGPNPSALEKLLVTRIIACWLDLQRWEEIALRGGGDVSIRLVEHRGKMRDRAHRRYLSAIKALAQLRKLAIPPVVLVTSQGGPQQLNVEGAR
jgi:hypothetical protein